MGRGRQFLAIHQKVAIARDAHHRPVPEPQRCGDSSGQAVPHASAGWRELCRHGAVMPITVPPAGEIAGAVADDGVFREPLAHRLDAQSQVELHAFPRLRLRPFEPFLVRLLPARKADEVGVDPLVEHLRELAHVGADRQVGDIDAPHLVRVGVHVDERLPRMLGGD